MEKVIYWIQNTGVSTGCPCASQITNIVCEEYDKYISRCLGANLIIFVRFIDDIFIPPNLVDSANLIDGQNISVKAILSFNKALLNSKCA